MITTTTDPADPNLREHVPGGQQRAFCVRCGGHFSLAGFRWMENGAQTDLVVGS